ncbi:hypothetical protein M406DRAFT_356885 [Cryphonectria parasitica EP155]|uniref:DUF4604 domain-containing protein n=1 Tax=Cryphonectria parasitica (strain ATCC 38755 / EP155) TaxID=660469 RepID=A0A9P4Y2H8_CRYP1|nr:uncharacterized protein M406DRAFT_356885 [Cryphonectria parasitica EP155]KAF3765235.1 hypothetical protein M406DRAFT_356885 [Cryphonectria parasitica EP155]
MSQKITGKNLHYDQSLPPFLARLKGQHTVDADSPDPILASRRRAAKPRSASEEAEDAPVIVDDDGNVVSGMRVGVDGTVTGGPGDVDGENDTEGQLEKDEKQRKEEDEEQGQKKKDTEAAAIGGSKKRKAGRVIGANAEDEVNDDVSSRDLKQASAEDGAGAAAKKRDTKNKGPEKGKKKAKKIKLSFGGDVDGDDG